IRMTRFFNIGNLLWAALILYSCNLFSAEVMGKNAQPIKEVETKFIPNTSSFTVNIDHSEWDKLLKKHVDKKGFVDYSAFKKDIVALDTYLTILSENEPTEVWSKEELLAYYINLYNAATVRLIVENYPLKSIKDLNRPWTKE